MAERARADGFHEFLKHIAAGGRDVLESAERVRGGFAMVAVEFMQAAELRLTLLFGAAR